MMLKLNNSKCKYENDIKLKIYMQNKKFWIIKHSLGSRPYSRATKALSMVKSISPEVNLEPIPNIHIN